VIFIADMTICCMQFDVCKSTDGTWYHHIMNISVFCSGINESHYRCPFPLGAWAELGKLQRNTGLTGCSVPTSYTVQIYDVYDFWY